MTKNAIRIENRNLGDLRPAPYNPRVELKPGDAEYEKLKRSVIEFGLVEPVILNEATGYVVGGHQRLSVLRDLGYTEVPTVIVNLSESREKALNVALNKISGDWDMPKLRDLIADLDDGWDDVTLTGFDEAEVAQLLNNLDEADEPEGEPSEDNFDPDSVKDEPPITKRGELWQLGKHRLFVGDATRSADIHKLMQGELADMVFTDPPYNVDYTGGTKDALKIENDKMADRQFFEFLKASFSVMIRATREGGAIYICHADSEGLNFRKAMIDSGWLMKQTLIWVKNSMVLGRQDYQWQHEPILYGWKPGAAHTWNSDRKQKTVIEDHDLSGVVIRKGDTDVITVFNGEDTIEIEATGARVVREEGEGSIWRIDRPKRSKEHPTMNPIKLVARAVRNSSKPGAVVLDTFAGSGSTLIACEQLGRSARVSELDPHYADVIIRRWEALTGSKAMKL